MLTVVFKNEEEELETICCEELKIFINKMFNGEYQLHAHLYNTLAHNYNQLTATSKEFIVFEKGNKLYSATLVDNQIKIYK